MVSPQTTVEGERENGKGPNRKLPMLVPKKSGDKLDHNHEDAHLQNIVFIYGPSCLMKRRIQGKQHEASICERLREI